MGMPGIIPAGWTGGPTEGGRRTTGRAVFSIAIGGREMTEPAGEMIKSLPASWAMDERRLSATLGEYMLPL